MNKPLIDELKKLLDIKRKRSDDLRKIKSENDWKTVVVPFPEKPVAPSAPYQPDEPAKPLPPDFAEIKPIKSEEEFNKEYPQKEPSEPKRELLIPNGYYQSRLLYIIAAAVFLFFIVGGIVFAFGIVYVIIGILLLVGGFAGPFLYGYFAGLAKYKREKNNWPQPLDNYHKARANSYAKYVKKIEEENIKAEIENEEKRGDYKKRIEEYEPQKKKYDERYAKYKLELETWRPKYREYQTKLEEYNLRMKDVEAQARKQIKANNAQIKANAEAEYASAIKQLSVDIPSRWDNSSDIKELIKYLEDGRADTLKEAINLLAGRLEREEAEEQRRYEEERAREEEEREARISARVRCNGCAHRHSCDLQFEEPTNCSAYIPR